MKTTPPTASSRATWPCVASYASSDPAATATQPGWPSSGAPAIRAASSSTVRDTQIRPCRARLSWTPLTSGAVPASPLPPLTRPAGSMTWIR